MIGYWKFNTSLLGEKYFKNGLELILKQELIDDIRGAFNKFPDFFGTGI